MITRDDHSNGHCLIGGTVQIGVRGATQGVARHGPNMTPAVLLRAFAARRRLINDTGILVLDALSGSQSG